MRILLMILSIVLIAMSVVLLIVTPIGGLLGITFGIVTFIHCKRMKAKSPNSAGPVQQPPQENVVTAKPVARPNKVEMHHVAGTSFRQDAIASLGFPNEDFDYSKQEIIDFGMEDERIYKLSFDPHHVELIEEPDDSQYPHAVRVIVDGVIVGYIKKGSSAHVRNLLHGGKIKKISASIEGGPYKCVVSEYDDEKDREVYTLEKDKTDYFVTIKLILDEQGGANS